MILDGERRVEHREQLAPSAPPAPETIEASASFEARDWKREAVPGGGERKRRWVRRNGAREKRDMVVAFCRALVVWDGEEGNRGEMACVAWGGGGEPTGDEALRCVVSGDRGREIWTNCVPQIMVAA